jgi:hypothetical protein
MNFRTPFALLAFLQIASAQTVTVSTLSLTASEERCAVGKPVSAVQNSDRQIFFRFLLARAPALRDSPSNGWPPARRSWSSSTTNNSPPLR